TVFDEVVVLAPFVAVLGAEPLGTGEAVRLGVGHAGHAALGIGRDPRQLAVDVALPLLAGLVDHFIVHADRVAAAAQRVGAADAHGRAGRRDEADLRGRLAGDQVDLAPLRVLGHQLGHAG